MKRVVTLTLDDNIVKTIRIYFPEVKISSLVNKLLKEWIEERITQPEGGDSIDKSTGVSEVL